MKVSRKRLKAEVPHPTYPEIVFVFQRLDQTDAEVVGNMFSKYESKDPATGESRYDIPPEEGLVIATRFLYDLRGLEDEDRDGAPIIYRGARLEEKIEILRLFGRLEGGPDLTIPLDPPRIVKNRNGKDVEIARQNVISWIYEKGMNPETFGISSGKG